jgi:predicted helicase
MKIARSFTTDLSASSMMYLYRALAAICILACIHARTVIFEENFEGLILQDSVDERELKHVEGRFQRLTSS